MPNALAKKSVSFKSVADQPIKAMFGTKDLSYAEITKKVHAYIKKEGLKLDN